MTKEEIKHAVGEALEEKLGDFFIAREQHYQHHQFLDSVLKTTEMMKGTACKSILALIILGIATILTLGAATWVKHQ